MDEIKFEKSELPNGIRCGMCKKRINSKEINKLVRDYISERNREKND